MAETYEGWTALELSMPAGVGEDDPRLDVLGSVMFELGASGLETKDRDGCVLLAAAFPPGFDTATLLELGAQALEIAELLEDQVAITTTPYAPIDWANHWRQHFHAIKFGEGPRALWIVPTWLEPPSDAAHVLRIDPSSAFGTGLHATTAMCLEKIVELSPIGSILDVGTGTGVLALAALELGARSAVATDNDPEALRVAAENAERNGYADRLKISGEDPRELGESFDVVVANILARPLIELADQIAATVKPGGTLILSGITRAQADDVLAAYEPLGFRRTSVETREEWARLELTAQ